MNVASEFANSIELYSDPLYVAFLTQDKVSVTGVRAFSQSRFWRTSIGPITIMRERKGIPLSVHPAPKTFERTYSPPA